MAVGGLTRRRLRSAVLANLTGAAALTTATGVFVIAVFLTLAAWPAIRFNGWHFFTSITWSSGNQYGGRMQIRNGVTGLSGASFGVLVFMFGTIASSALAMVIATPLALFVAIALVYKVPPRLRLLANTLVELMAGVPSVVYGLWGVIVLVPFIGNTLGPFVTTLAGRAPLIGGGAGAGYGLLAAGIVLSIMVLPIMAATARDIIHTVPLTTTEGSIALGATVWQTVTRAVLPPVAAGLVGSALLALGRALGETIAVLMVSGSAQNQLPANLFEPINTMAAAIVAQLDSALTDASGLSVSSLAEIALLLFVMTLAVNVVGRLIVRATAGSQVTM